MRTVGRLWILIWKPYIHSSAKGELGMAKKCNVCGGDNLEPGAIQSTGKIYFRPKNVKFLSFKTANIEVKAYLCMSCGNVALIADTQKASVVLGQAESH